MVKTARYGPIAQLGEHLPCLIDLQKISKRLLVSIPIFVLCFVIMLLPYDVVWRYFAWSNQVLSVFTLWAITIWLSDNKKNFYVTLLPAMFMTAVTSTYIMFAPEGFSLLTQSLFGFKIGYAFSVGFGISMSVLFLAMFLYRAKNKKRL